MGWFRNLKIKNKMIVGFTTVILLMAALSAFAIAQLNLISDTFIYVIEHPLEAEIQLLHFKGNISDIRRLTNSMSLFSDTGDPARIEGYAAEADAAFKDGVETLNTFENIVKTDPKLTAEESAGLNSQLNEIKKLFARYKAEVCDPVAFAAREGNKEEALKFLILGVDVNNELVAQSDALYSVAEFVSELNYIEAEAKSAETIIIVLSIAVAAALVSVFIALFLATLINKPLKRLTDMASDFVNGNVNINVDRSSITEDEIGHLTGDICRLVEIIRMLTDDLTVMASEHERGEIDFFPDAGKYTGAFREVMNGTNEMVRAHLAINRKAIECFSAIANGDFDADVEKQPGKEIFINEAIDGLRENLTNVNDEIHDLALSAIDGQLSNRIDSGKYKGGWAALMAEMNNLMESVIAPINEASEVMGHVSAGMFDIMMEGEYLGDFKAIKDSINTTVTNIASYIDEISNVLGALAEDNLDQSIDREYVGKFSSIKEALTNIIVRFNSVISNIFSSSDQVAAGAKQISESSMDLASGASEQASSVEELNATIQNIDENTKRNTQNAREAEKLSAHSKRNASQGNEDMNRMLQSMEGIKESSGKIAQIIRVIEDIAFQTNLLALNAAVEAARAGVHGKGFSVVADEVRSLAAKTQVSAKETAELIEASIHKVNEGTGIADQTAETLKAIINDVTGVADIISAISKASEEQSLAIGQVLEGINEVTEVVQSNSATSEESASASQELASQSDVLREMVSGFRLMKNY